MKEVGATAPANLLLLGEYAVLEEGGLGIAVAPDVRARGVLNRGPAGDRVAIVGSTGQTVYSWPGDHGLLGHAAERLEDAVGSLPRGTSITLDSAAFFDRKGRKSGLGSSASVVVILTTLWLVARGELDPSFPPPPNDVFPIALQAHRAAQHGKGSGYDVACSTYGGSVRFQGGQKPDVHRIELPWLPALSLVRGPQPVQTVSAVGEYRRWKAQNPDGATEFLKNSNRLVSAFAGALDWNRAAPILRNYCDLARGLGEAIGVGTDLGMPDSGRAILKAVGAGNELGVLIGNPDPRAPRPSGVETALAIAKTGIAWA